jgi:hypothetical protein
MALEIGTLILVLLKRKLQHSKVGSLLSMTEVNKRQR